jgi:hypothetical protein
MIQYYDRALSRKGRLDDNTTISAAGDGNISAAPLNGRLGQQ